MNEPGHYPPPDFACPPLNSIQPLQQQQTPCSSSFHPSMWSWGETPSEPSWDVGGSPGWYHGAAAGSGYGFPSGHGNYEPRRPYSKNFGRERHQGGHLGGRQNYGPLNHHGRKQKNKKEPEYSHFCDTCDRGFKNQEKYDEHVSQHVKCSVPDCSFVAHEKIVSIHWKNNHAPGAKRIKLDTPEEIARWREERRKNYPTLQNIEKKRKVLELREETGGVLETAQFGRMRGRGQGHGWINRGFQGQHLRGPHPLDSSSTERPRPLSQPYSDGDPLGVLASSDHDSDREDPATESRTGGLVVAPKQMSSALGSLLANYGSMSESESDEEPKAFPIQRAKELVQENQALRNRIPPNYQDRGPFRGTETSSDGRETHKVPKPDSGLHMPNSRRGRGGRGGRRGRHQHTPQTRRPTLLEMLLAPDIRHERNVVLQCVRYIVQNHFFGLESRPQTQEGIGDKGKSAITSGEHEGRQEELSEEVTPVTQSASLVGGEGCSAEGGTPVPVAGGLEGLETSKFVVVDQDQGLLMFTQVCSEQSNDPTVESAISADPAAGNFIQNTEEPATRDSHSHDFSTEDKITSTSDMYDDEIWESPDTGL